MTPTERVLEALREHGYNPIAQPDSDKHWQCCCPAHDDRNPSLSISTGIDGRALVYCHAACEAEAICEAVGLSLRDLMAERSNRNDEATRGKSRIVATYDYRDEADKIVFQVVRFEPKDFRQRRPDDNGGWNWKVKGIRVVPFLLPRIVKHPNETAFVVEGEKDALALSKLGLVATCNSGGAGKWRAEHAEFLRGRHVVVLPDNDEAGGKHADQVARSLSGVATSIKVIELPGLPPKGDVSDWLAGGGTKDELLRIVEDSSEWEPTNDRLFTLQDQSGWTDLANSKRFVDKYHSELLFVPAWGKWLSWDGCRWKDDSGIGVQQRAKRYADSLWGELGRLASQLGDDGVKAVASFIRATSQAAKISAFLKLAESDERVVCQIEELNSDPLLLNVQNGTIDLRTGTLRTHSLSDRITQLAPVTFDPAAQCPRWLQTLELVFDGDLTLVEYVQLLLGYSISGDVGLALLPIAYGSGNNGKSTVWNCVAELLGDYAALANESLLLGDNEGHPTDKAMLYQKRFVPISEPERGSRLRESRVKELTGDALVTARRMREDFWTFKRTHTFWLSTNHLPKVSGTDQAIWRRIKIIPFTVDISKKVKPVPDFAGILATEEGSGILNWLLAGWMRYQTQQAIVEPDAVRRATTGYRADSDTLGEFLAENCVVEAGAIATASSLFERYQSDGGKWSKTAFGLAMAERFEKEKSMAGEFRNKVIYHGIRLVTDDEKTSEKMGSLPVDTSHPVNSINPIAHTKLTGRLGAARSKADLEVCFDD